MNTEPLDPELAHRLYAGDSFDALQHPLVYGVPYTEAMNAYYNQQLRQKREAVAVAEAQRDWAYFIALHERPHRCDALGRVVWLLAPRLYGRHYWQLVRDTWADSENIHQCRGDWETLLHPREDRGTARSGWSDEDHAFFADLTASEIPAWRGTTSREKRPGWSWTTNRERADWFARRTAKHHGGDPVTYRAFIPRDQVIFAINDRQESELVTRAIRSFTSCRRIAL